MVLHPRHRADCADLFVAPHQTGHVDLEVPADVLDELEHTAVRAGRTWNDQLCYLMKLLLGNRLPDFDDERSVEDWRILLRPCRFRLTEAGDWIPFACLGERRHELQTIPPAHQRT